jgi:outer membrane protein assembly factor BamB
MLVRLALVSRSAVCAAAFLSVVSSTYADDWPRWRGPTLNGISNEKILVDKWPDSGPKQLWKASIGIGMSAISVANGKAVSMGNEGDKDTVWCLDAVSGKEIWKHTYASPLDPNLYEGGPSATPTIEGDRVYTLSKDGQMFCLGASDGKVIWQVNLVKEHEIKKPEWGFASSPLIIADRLYLNAGGFGACFNRTTGKLVWLSSQEPAAYATPVPFKLGDKEALVFQASRELVAVAPGDGAALWRTEWKTSYDTSSVDIIPSGKKFHVTSYRQPSVLFDTSSGEPKRLWETKDFWQHMNPAVLVKGVLYGFHGDGRHDHEFKAVNFETGQIAWTEKNLPVGSTIVANGKLILLTGKGELVIAEPTPEKFSPVARAQIMGGKCWTSPALANGLLYARNVKGDLVCVAVK